MVETVDFNEEEVKKYLDDSIQKWRKIRDDSNHLSREIAVFYVDAFQSVRMSLFGEILSEE